MKTLIASIFLFLIIGCQNPTGNKNSLNQIILKTDKTSYSKTDTIQIILKNESCSGLPYWRMNGSPILGVVYQKWLDTTWSMNLYFFYNNHHAIYLDTLQPNTTFNCSMNAEKFNTVGIFRLVFFDRLVSLDIYSNKFEIK